VLSITHLLVSTAAASVALGSADPAVLGVAAIASQLPDLDKTDSFMGRLCLPLATWIEQRYAHRTITHSFLSTLAVGVVLLPVGFWSWPMWWAGVIGQFLGWFADCFTKAGCAVFWPNPVRLVIPGNPRSRLRSGSTYEYWVMAIAAILLVISTNLASNGGVSEQFARNFFQDAATAAQLFQRYGSSRVVAVEVMGMHTVTSQAIASAYTVIEAEANDFVGEDVYTHRLYKIGTSPDAQIRPHRVRTRLGEALAVEAQSYRLKDLMVSEVVGQVPPDAYLTGSLLLDDMEDVELPIEVELFPSMRVFGGQVELRNARPAEVEALLGDFWIVSGKLIVKTRTPLTTDAL